MRARLIAIALLAACIVGLGGMAATTGANAQPGSTPDTYVNYWDTVGAQAFTASGLAAPEGFVIFANVDIAVYDSLMAIRGGYQPFAVDVGAPEGASAEAAVAAAARDILVHYLPAQAATIIDPAYVTSLGTIPDGQAKDDGIATGQEVAAILIAQRADDGFRAAVTYTPPDPPIPGVWIPTSQAPPIGTYMQFMRPFSNETAGQFRPAGPPALSSKSWARDYNEVKEIGSRTSTTRTADQTLAARFWAEPPVQQDHSSYRKFVVDHQLDVVEASRFMALVSVASADAIIGCFEAKYHYAFWRPITAIRAGDTDGNDATGADPNWIHLLGATPNHPEYPQRTRLRQHGRRADGRPLPGHRRDRLHDDQPHRSRRSTLRQRQSPRGRSRLRPDLGRHPLPHQHRGRSQDRDEDSTPDARTPLPTDGRIVEPARRSCSRNEKPRTRS